MKRQSVAALVLLLLIPLVCALGGVLFSLINPESAAGHPNYVRNFQLLTLLRITCWWAAIAVAGALWVLVCLLVIRAKKRSNWWLLLAVFGPFGLAVLAMLSDREPAPMDRHALFLNNLNAALHAGYAVCLFATILVVAYWGMVLNRTLMIRYQAATTGVSPAQILQQQNASSGMWAFAEGNEVLFLMAVLYLIWPMMFNFTSRWAATMGRSKAQ